MIPPTDLPIVEVTPRPLEARPPSADTLTPGGPARELFVTPCCARLSVRDHDFGFIELGGVPEPIAPRSGGGVWLGGVKGGNGHDRCTLVTGQTADRAEGGARRLRETQAWFDMLRCQVREVRRMGALARPVGWGLA